MPDQQTTPPQRIAILGGTFDPVHKGHIQPLLEIAAQFDWQHIRLVPTCTPPHRAQPQASNEHRIAMLQQVAQQDPRLQVDTWEIEQGKPSRTWPTLQHFRQQFPHSKLYFVIGMDSYVTLNQWLHWQQLTELAELVVLPRPGYLASQAPEPVQDWFAKPEQKARIHFVSPTAVACSATELRSALSARDHERALNLGLFDETFRYIEAHNLYPKLPT